MPIFAVQVPLGVYLPAIFAQTYRVPLSILGVIFLVEKLWGTVADPLVGALSDRTRNRLGRRRSWILAGSTVFGLSGLCLFFPPATVSPWYLGFLLFVFYLGWSMIQIPFYAWSGEVSSDYHERTRVATYQTVAGSIGLLLVLVLPTIIDQVRPGDGALKLHVMGALILFTLVIGVSATLRAFPEPTVPRHTNQGLSSVQTIRLVLANPLLMRVLASDFAVTVGQNIRGALFLFFISIYMGLPHWASGLFLVQFVFGIGAGPLWMKIGQRLGKHRAAVVGELAQVVVNFGLLFVVPGQLPLLLTLTIAQGFAQGSGNLMLRSMVADIADEHRFKTGEDRTGLFFSIFSISMKAGTAAAVGIALPLVAWFGFDPKVSQNSPGALRALLWVFALGPSIGHLISAAFINRFPLDARAHARIRESLAEREVHDISL
jgi:GPH family glycoside/pentoside/hexuronide:cation symporter